MMDSPSSGVFGSKLEDILNQVLQSKTTYWGSTVGHSIEEGRTAIIVVFKNLFL